MSEWGNPSCSARDRAPSEVLYDEVMFYVYVLENSKSNKKFYIGFTSNLKRRFKEHNSGTEPSTKYGIPWKLTYYEAYQTEKLARQKES